MLRSIFFSTVRGKTDHFLCFEGYTHGILVSTMFYFSLEGYVLMISTRTNNLIQLIIGLLAWLPLDVQIKRMLSNTCSIIILPPNLLSFAFSFYVGPLPHLMLLCGCEATYENFTMAARIFIAQAQAPLNNARYCHLKAIYTSYDSVSYQR